MQRIGWGRALAFGALAIGVPWVVVALIATVLLELSDSVTAGGVVGSSAAIAAVSVILCAVMAKIRTPRSRTSAVVCAWLACAIGIILVPLAIPIPGGAWTFAPIVAMVAGLIFFFGGGAAWAAGGALAASRIVRVERRLGPRWVPLAWVAVGILAAACAVAIMLTAGPPHGMAPIETFDTAPERSAWRWFPLGWEWSWGQNRETPGWVPTFVLANGLGLVSVGVGLWIGRRGPEVPS